MVISRYPDSATLYYTAPGSANSIGVMTLGTINTLTLIGRLEKNNAGYIRAEDGTIMKYDYTWFGKRIPITIPDNYHLEFSVHGRKRPVLDFNNLQTHLEIKI